MAWQNTRTVILFAGLLAILAVLAGGFARERTAPRAAANTIAATPPQQWQPPATKDLDADGAAAFASVADRITPAVVRIETEKLPDARRARWLPSPLRTLVPHDSTTPAPEMAGGSGFLVSPDGYILTNNHVVEGADIITVTLYNKRSFPAQVIGLDPTTDVALIKIDAQDLAYVPLGDSDRARVGEWVLAIGNPGFQDASTLDFTVTSGIISAKGRPLYVLNAEADGAPGNFAIEDFIQTDAAINPGNSGGPLVNIRGEVIGINTAIASSTGFNEGYAFAVPSSLARRVMSDLLAYGRVRRPLLGISIKDVTQEDAEVYGLPEIAGALIEDFADGSPAQQAGIERGDVIVAVDGRKVESVGQLQRFIADHKPGEEVGLRIVRYGETKTFRIRLVESPEQPVAQPRRANGRPTGGGRIGVQIGELNAEIANELGFERAGGAVITAVADYGAAARKGIHAGSRILEINRKPIEHARDAQDELRGLGSGEIVSLVLQDPDGAIYIANVRVP
ncbi:MAG: trypsin-like peptidase domain-containing protein [Gemmatimonadota bacterium]